MAYSSSVVDHNIVQTLTFGCKHRGVWSTDSSRHDRLAVDRTTRVFSGCYAVLCLQQRRFASPGGAEGAMDLPAYCCNAVLDVRLSA